MTWLASEIAFSGPVPDDIGATGIVGRTTAWYDPYETYDRETNKQLDNNQLLRFILRNTDIDILLRTLGNAFFPRTITVGTDPTEIIAPNRTPRGYILINPNTTVSGVVTATTVFPAGTIFPVASTPSASINVAGHGTAAFFLNITEATAGPMTVDLQSQDPVSGLWSNVQSDIFGGVVTLTPNPIYANVGTLGVDQNMRLMVNVAGDTFTGSIGAVLKPALAGTISGPTIFIGNQDVTTTLGFPLLSGQKETIYLRENTPLYGIAVAATELRLFELQ